MSTLQIISILGLILYFGILLFAVSKEKKNNNVLDYFFGGRTIPFWALSITFIASWWGAGSAISTADLAYVEGISAFWYYGAPVLISSFLMILMAKMIRKVNYLTQGQMMKERYNKTVSKMLSALIVVFMTITAASQMVALGDFFGTYLGLNYEFAVIVGTSIILIYSMFGGFRGVVITDIIQFVLLLVSAIVIFCIAMFYADGFNGIAMKAQQQGLSDYTNVFSGVSKYLTYIITFGCAWMIQANVWQRISAAKNIKDAQKMTIMSFFAYIPLYLMVVFTGMAAFVIYDTMPVGGVILAIIQDYMNPFLGAIVFVGISAAIMSTTDSLINTAAMTLSVDLNDEKDEKKKLRYSQLSTLVVTIVAVLISLRVQSILSVSWIASDIITTGVFVPLILGFFFRIGNSKGAIASMIYGSVFCLYNFIITIGINLPRFWELQSTQQVIIGALGSLIIYLVVSFIFKSDEEYQKADAFIKLRK